MSNSQAPSQIQYSEYMVAYMDILGFKKLIQQSDKLEAIYGAMESVRFLTDVTSYTKHFEIHRLQISDGLLFWAKVNTYRDYMIFMFKVGSAIASLHSMNIITRGAFSYGNHFYKNEILVSPAFIEAYEYESKIAKYPRMILSPSFIDRIEQLAKTIENPESRLSEFNLLNWLDNDGYRYINYLGYLTFGLELGAKMATLSQVKTNLHRHKSIIEKALKNETEEYIRAKYIWLGNYHNKFLNSEDIKIDDPNVTVDKNLLEHRTFKIQ